MKKMIPEKIFSFLMLFSFFMAFSIGMSAQKTLRLNLKNGMEKEGINLKSSMRSGQKMVKRMDFYEEGEHKTMSMYFEYDEKGRVIKTINKGYYYKNFFENAEVSYHVNGNTLTVNSSPINAITKSEAGESAVCELNEMGYVEEATYMDEDGFSFSFSLVYDEQGYPFAYDEAGSSGVYKEYYCINGNLYYKKKQGNSNEYVFTNYENKANLDFNKMFVETFGEVNLQMEFLGYFGKKDRNLLERVGNETFQYTFDKDGYVTKIKSSRDAVCTAEVYYDEESAPDPSPDNNPTTEDELEDFIDNAPEGSEDFPTDIFIPSGGITLKKPLDIDKHIRLKGGKLIRSDENHYAMLRVRSGYSLALDDITIDGNKQQLKDGSLVVYGKLKIGNGVSIKNCYRTEADTPSGAICVAQNGVLIMDGGTISGNIGSYGSAIYNEGSVIMSGGVISANRSQIGTIVNNAGGEFIMTGGKISSNQITEGCGGVFVSTDCSFTMTGGEISGNADCDLYTWSDLQIGGAAKVGGLIWLNEGNRFNINSSLHNNWLIRYVDMPSVGAVVAAGADGYQLTKGDLHKISYYQDLYHLKLWGNTIILDQIETGIEELNENQLCISVSGNWIKVEGFSPLTFFTIYDISGRFLSIYKTDDNGQCAFSLNSGIYLLRHNNQTHKLMVK